MKIKTFNDLDYILRGHFSYAIGTQGKFICERLPLLVKLLLKYRKLYFSCADNVIGSCSCSKESYKKAYLKVLHTIADDLQFLDIPDFIK